MTSTRDNITTEVAQILTDGRWHSGNWETFLSLAQQPAYQKAKNYFWREIYQFIMGVGANHGDINAVIFLLLSFYCTLRHISHRAFINTSYRKEGMYECQPDLSYYFPSLGDCFPTGSSIVNLNQYSPPDLVIEISDTFLADDIGIKRLLYEEIGVKEYWVIDVQKLEIFAFAIDVNSGSRRIYNSEVLKGLSLQRIMEALHASQTMDHSQLGQWWIEKIKYSNQI